MQEAQDWESQLIAQMKSQRQANAQQQPAQNPPQSPAVTLHQSVGYGVQQDPVSYAMRLDLQKKLGLPPEVSAGQEPELQQAADLNSIDYTQFAATNPRTTAFASNPDNAAVSGVGEIQRLGGVEQNAAGMRAAMPSMRAYTPTWWERAQLAAKEAYRAVKHDPQADPVADLYQYPLTRYGIDVAGGAAGLVGNVGALLGWQGNGPTKENLLQRIDTGLKPENSTDPLATYHNTDGLDFVARTIGPMIPAMVASGGTSLLARVLGWSPTAAKVAAGLSVGGMFTADQAGQTYTSQLAAGKSADDARLASNRVAAINALPNALFGATDVLPFMRDNPLLTSVGLGAATGATGQAAQNVVTGQPWAKGVPASMVQGAAMQGGMHLGFGAIGGDGGADAVPPPQPGSYVDHLASAVDAAEQSDLRGRSPEKFYEATQGIFAGDASLRISSDKFSAYFAGKGLDPAEIAKGLGSPNYAEALLSGGDVEIPPADFLSKLDSEHQKALLPDVVDPATELTTRQHKEGRDELAQWVMGGGADKLIADTAAADAETAASPEFQAVKEQLRAKYESAGESPEVAETLATKDANVYSNLARNAGMKPSELLGLYNPKVVKGEAPGGYASALADHIAADPQGAIDEYNKLSNTDGGRILNTDEARELSEHYRADRTRSADVHEPASKFIKDLYARKLNEPVGEGRDPLVLFTAGGTGAGKSTSLKTAEGEDLNARADIIYDTNMNTLQSAQKKIEQALDSGRDVHVQYTYRDPVEALTGGALPRAMRMGRTVPLAEHVKTHVGARRTVAELREAYAGDPRVTFSAVDNSRGKGKAAAAEIDSLSRVEENGLRERLQDALKSEHEAGRISNAVRRGTEGSRSNDDSSPALGRTGAGESRVQPEPGAADATAARGAGAGFAGKPESERDEELRLSHSEPIPGHDGKSTTLLTSARELPATYRLVEADSLVPSHDAQTFAKNPKYPDGLQERAYDTSKEAQARVIQQAQNYDSRYTVNTNPDAVNGPPVITPDGVVLGGNSRAMSTQRLYDADGSAYRDALKEQAATFGFTPEQVDGMKNPILVRQVESPVTADDARRLGSELNKSMTGAMGVSERAVSAGKNIKPETLRSVADMMQVGDSTLREVMSKHGSELVKMLAADGVITDRERPQFIDAATGGLSEEGKTFVERALMGSVIDDPRLMDAAPKSVLNKLERSIGAITSFASRPDEWNLLPAIREAVAELGAIQRSGSTVELRLGQTDMFGEARNPLVDAMIRTLDSKPNEVRKAFEDFARDSDANLPGQSRMFGEASAFDAFNHAFGSNLSEQEYHDGLDAAFTTDKTADSAGGAYQPGGESLPGSSDRDAAPGSSDGAGGLGSGTETLNQSSEDGARGWFRVLPDGSYEIGKTRIGDLSTFVHEPAHAYLKIIGDLAKREGASETLKGDYQKVLDFLGAKDGETLTREQQETWARANEQYLREGKAPSPGLKGTFQRFAIWLGSVYKKATDLGVHLTDDIRGVFDRLYAAESGVERAEAEAGPKLFTTPEEAGWTEEQFAQYAKDNSMSAEQARADLLGRLNEAAVRARSEAWRNEEQNVRTAVTAEVDQSPEYTAIRSLRRGSLDDGEPLTMSRDALVEQFGEDRVKQLQKLHPGLYRLEGGIDPESAAEILGFGSADEMISSLEAVPRRSEVIEKATRHFMTEKHGDIRYDGTLDDQARIALENDKRADSLHSELTALRKKLEDVQRQAAGQKQAMRDLSVAPIAAYREAAHQMIEAKAVADIQPTRYLDASRKYSREAFDALRRGDTEAAATAKHKELMNHFLFREATKAKEYIGKFESYAKRMQAKAVQSKLGLAGDDYRDQFNRILGRYGLGPAMGPATRTLAEWAAAQYGEGKEPAIDPAVLDETRMVSYRNAPVSEVRAVHDALVNVRKLAYLELEMEVNGRKVEFAKAVSSMAGRAYESLKSNPRPVFEENRTAGEKVGDFVNRGAALLDRMEFIMKRLDGGVEGPWHDNLWHLAADAQGKEYELHEAVTKQVGDMLANMSKGQWAKLDDKVTINGVGEPLTRQRMIAIALNTGNDGNLDRLEKTFIANNWDPRAIEDVKQALTRQEWQFVQGVWESLKPLGKAQSELEQRLTGLPPVMVKPTPLHLKLADGTEMVIDGGYYPIAYDPKRSTRGAQQDATVTAQNVMEAGYGRAATSRGNMQARTGYGGPLQLDYEQVLTQHTAKVVKDISHREFLLAANKLIMDPQTRQAVQDTLGLKREEQMMPWLRTIVNDKNGSIVQGVGDVSRAMSALRTNVVKAALGFKFSTVLLQLTHASSIFLHTSPGSYAQAMIDFMAHPKAMSEEIRQLSPNEMKSRGENLDRDMRAVLRDGTANKSIGDVWAKFGMAPVQLMDHVLSFPLWKAVYQDALKENIDLPEDEAKYRAMQKADGAVRMGLGSNAPKDLAAIMRNNDLTKLLTTMGGFHNLKWNQMADQVSSYRNGGNARQLSYGLLMSAMIPAVMGPLITGHGPKDDENVGLWAAKRALLFPLETISILGNVVEALERKSDVSFTPIAGMLERAGRAAKEAAADKEDKDWEGIGMNALQSAMEAFGVSGTDQMFKTARYAKQAQDGKIANPNAWDAVAGSAQPAHR